MEHGQHGQGSKLDLLGEIPADKSILKLSSAEQSFISEVKATLQLA